MLHSLFFKIRHALILGAIVLSTFSLAQSKELVADRGQLVDSFRSLAQDPGAAKFFLEPLLQRYTLSEGLVVLGGKPHLHELKTAEKLSSYWRQFGYTFVLMAQVNGLDVPGFDGLLLNEENEPIANISLKSNVNPSPETLSKTMGEALEKIKTFSRVEKWVDHVINSTEWRNFPNAKGESPESFKFSDDSHYESFIHIRDSLQFMISVLGVESNRPTWVIMDLESSERLDKKDIQKLGLKFELSSIHRGFVFVEKGLYRMDSDEFKYERLKDCKTLLRP